MILYLVSERGMSIDEVTGVVEFVYRIGRTLGSFTAALRLDVLVFTAGIAEHAAPVRARV